VARSFARPLAAHARRWPVDVHELRGGCDTGMVAFCETGSESSRQTSSGLDPTGRGKCPLRESSTNGTSRLKQTSVKQIGYDRDPNAGRWRAGVRCGVDNGLERGNHGTHGQTPRAHRANCAATGRCDSR
jgi:hypothetical protein